MVYSQNFFNPLFDGFKKEKFILRMIYEMDKDI